MKYRIITYGCQLNKADSGKIAKILEKMGHKPASENEADLIVFNMCSVRQSAVDRALSKIDRHSQKKKIILAGCLLESDKKKLRNKVAEIWQPGSYFNCSPITGDPHISFVPIMTGCNNFCSYCVVPFTRGREYSRPADEILEQIKNLVKKGFKEITLLGQNVNSYIDKGINFSKLLKLLNEIPGNFQIKFLTSHPKDMSDELIEAVADCDKVAKEIHLPIQSGDNRILKKMNRGYTVESYKKLIDKIRKKIPRAEISTDIIVGFPGETKKQFNSTVKLLKEIGFSQIYAAAYSPRPGTAAAKFKDNVSSLEKKRRKRIVLGMIKKAPL